MAAFEHVLLTIDVIEGYCYGHSPESFSRDKSAVAAVYTNVRMLSRHAEHVELSYRLRYPAVPWAFLRTLDSITLRFNLQERPYLLWNLVHERLFSITEAIKDQSYRARVAAEPKIG